LEECGQQPTERHIVKYDWAVLELLDQMVRDKSGGLMLERVRDGHYDADYALERYGDVFKEFYRPPSSGHPEPRKTLWKRIVSKSPRELSGALFRKLNAVAFAWLQSRKGRELTNDPRETRESNLWTYDRLSLRLLLEEQGFKKFSVKSYTESDIVGWERYNLDQSNFGDYAIEPSLYVEASVEKKVAPRSNAIW
jgi:hypothetical protein